LRGVLPYFKPLFPAIKRFCNLCGAETAADTFETQAVREMEAREKGGQYVFCAECQPFVGEVGQIIEAERSRLEADAARDINDKLEVLAREALEARGRKPPGGEPHPPSTTARKAPAAQARQGVRIQKALDA
jgi:hypothetical protein